MNMILFPVFYTTSASSLRTGLSIVSIANYSEPYSTTSVLNLAASNDSVILNTDNVNDPYINISNANVHTFTVIPWVAYYGLESRIQEYYNMNFHI